jgi:uncharacterized membrane protein
MRIASVGHAVFSVTFVALGIMGMIKGEFTPVWQPVARGLPGREALVYVSALVSLSAGVGLLWQRTAANASRVLLAFLLLWLVAFRVSHLVAAPALQDSWSGFGETAVFVAAAGVLYLWFTPNSDTQPTGLLGAVRGMRAARVLYALALLPFGVAHFNFAKETAALVPSWLPLHLAWAYLTGCTYLAAGVAMLVNFHARLAAMLSVFQIGLFTLLVWMPIVILGHPDSFQWSETILSAALTAAAWVVADSYSLADAHRASARQR